MRESTCNQDARTMYAVYKDEASRAIQLPSSHVAGRTGTWNHTSRPTSSAHARDPRFTGRRATSHMQMWCSCRAMAYRMRYHDSGNAKGTETSLLRQSPHTHARTPRALTCSCTHTHGTLAFLGHFGNDALHALKESPRTPSATKC